MRALMLVAALLAAPAGAQSDTSVDADVAEAVPAPPRASDPAAALQTGNRLFRDGQLEAAVEAYRAGADPVAVSPTLAYNLGATLHHLDRLPEALLWYRRAQPAADPWLADNLLLVRRALDAPQLHPVSLTGRAAHAALPLRIAAVVLAWLALAALVLHVRRGGTGSLMPAAGLAALALMLYVLVAAAVHRGPQPIVLLHTCTDGGIELPAGSEVWARAAAEGDGAAPRWQLDVSAAIRCDGDRAAAVRPRR
ncbi:MAG: tetratricopeptide repeat protein [Acidobacteriota bacterium]